jgi:hypothetical protein
LLSNRSFISIILFGIVASLKLISRRNSSISHAHQFSILKTDFFDLQSLAGTHTSYSFSLEPAIKKQGPQLEKINLLFSGDLLRFELACLRLPDFPEAYANLIRHQNILKNQMERQ